MSTMRVVERRGANHGLHLFLTIITMGLWAFTGWPLAAMLGRKTVTRVPATTDSWVPAHPVPVHQGVSGGWVFNHYTNQWEYLR